MLSDGTVRLRPHVPGDIDALVEYATDPEVRRWTGLPDPFGEAAAAEFLAACRDGWDRGTAMNWAVEADGRFAGNVVIEGRALIGELDFGLHPAFRGIGIMRRAVTLAVRHAFEAGGKQVIRWRSAEGNLGSLRLAHALGFSLDARVPDLLEIRGEVQPGWIGTLRAGDDLAPRTPWRATTFTTERFRMRPLAEKDDPRIRETLDDPISRTYLFDRPKPLLLEHAAAERNRKWWTAARGESCTWAVADRETDRYLADISLLRFDDTTGAEAGFYTHPDARGIGVLRETFPAAVEHAFAEFGLRRMTLLSAASNTGSRALAEASGFREVGVQQLAALSGDDYEDLVGYELYRG